MKKYLYLHLGTSKTGTTAIQHFLMSNDHLLAEKGFHYLKTLRWKDGGHHPLAWILYYRHFHKFLKPAFESYIVNQEKYLVELKNEINNIGDKSIILSSEIFPLLNEEAVDELLSFFPQMQVKVIIYIRDFMEQSLSIASEVIKLQDNPFNDDRLSNIYDNHVNFFFSYLPQSLELWKNKLGLNNIIFRKYNRGCFIGGNIFADFLSALGLYLTDDFIVSDKLQNESLKSCETIYFKDLLNRLTLNVSQEDLKDILLEWEKENHGTKLFFPSDVSNKVENAAINLQTQLKNDYLDETFKGFFNKNKIEGEPLGFKLSYSSFENILNYINCRINNFKDDFIESLSHALDNAYDYELKCREFEDLFNNSLKGKKAAFWGCGNIATKLFKKYSFLRNGTFDVIDKNIEKQGENFWGHTILPPSAVAKKLLDTVIITSVKYADEISKDILEKYPTVKYIFKLSDLSIQIGFEPVEVL